MSAHAPDCMRDRWPYRDGNYDDCAWCGGEGWQEPDDPLAEGYDDVPCKSCDGTGLACRQVIW